MNFERKSWLIDPQKELDMSTCKELDMVFLRAIDRKSIIESCYPGSPRHAIVNGHWARHLSHFLWMICGKRYYPFNCDTVDGVNYAVVLSRRDTTTDALPVVDDDHPPLVVFYTLAKNHDVSKFTVLDGDKEIEFPVEDDPFVELKFYREISKAIEVRGCLEKNLQA